MGSTRLGLRITPPAVPAGLSFSGFNSHMASSADRKYWTVQVKEFSYVGAGRQISP